MWGKHHHEDEDDRLKRIEQEEAEILRVEKDIEARLRRAESATLTIYKLGLAANLDANIKRRMSMPVSIEVGQTAVAVYQEWDGPNGTGNKLAPAGAVTFAVDNATIATVDQTGNILGVAPGQVTISATDAAHGMVATAALAVTGVVAQSATLTITPGALPTPAPTPTPTPTPAPTPSAGKFGS